MYFSAAVRTALLALLAASQVAAVPLSTGDGVAPAHISQRSVSASAPGLLAARREEAASEEAASEEAVSEEPKQPAPKPITRGQPRGRKPGRDPLGVPGPKLAVCRTGQSSIC